ncbi:hypothetical protein VNI00_015678, partial [Paramarasmius palmivorus]
MKLSPPTTNTQFVGPVAQRMKGGVEPDSYEKKQHGDAGAGKLGGLLSLIVPDAKMVVGFVMGAVAVATWGQTTSVF